MCNREIRQSLVRGYNASLKQRIFRTVSLCQKSEFLRRFFFFDPLSSLSCSLEQVIGDKDSIYSEGEKL